MSLHGIIRCVVLGWACCLITFAVVYAFLATPHVPGDTAAALSAVIGILTLAIGLYEWRVPRRVSRDAGEPH